MFTHNNQSKSFDFAINQQLFLLWLLQIVLFITGALLRNLPTAAGNTWLNQESNDAQNVPLCGNTQSLEQKAWASTEKLNTHVLEKWNPVQIPMLLWAGMNVPDANRKKNNQYLGEDYLSASQRPKCKIHSTADYVLSAYNKIPDLNAQINAAKLSN